MNWGHTNLWRQHTIQIKFKKKSSMKMEMRKQQQMAANQSKVSKSQQSHKKLKQTLLSVEMLVKLLLVKKLKAKLKVKKKKEKKKENKMVKMNPKSRQCKIKNSLYNHTLKHYNHNQTLLAYKWEVYRIQEKKHNELNLKRRISSSSWPRGESFKSR